jgi:hypothetical protein
MFDDFKISDKYICEKAKTCNRSKCMHKFVHGRFALGRPEQPDTDKIEDNWDCSNIPCSEGGKCVHV